MKQLKNKDNANKADAAAEVKAAAVVEVDESLAGPFGRTKSLKHTAVRSSTPVCLNGLGGGAPWIYFGWIHTVIYTMRRCDHGRLLCTDGSAGHRRRAAGGRASNRLAPAGARR